MRGYMEAIQPDGGMPELLKRQIDRLETAIDISRQIGLKFNI